MRLKKWLINYNISTFGLSLETWRSILEKKFVSIVVYLHNNENDIKGFLDMMEKSFVNKYENVELIAVNDACIDMTVENLKEIVKEKEFSFMLNIIHMGFYQGVEASMNAGRDSAIGDFVFEFDSPIVDYADDIPEKLYEKSLEGYDIVSATGSASQKFTSKLFYGLYNAFNHGNGDIGPETFRVLSRRAINRIKSMGSHIPYRKAVYANCGLKTANISYKSTISKKRKNKFSERGALAFDSFVYFTNVLEKLSAFICGLFLLITIVVGVYIVTDYFSVNKPVAGWVSTMAFMAFGFFGVFALLTIILKYLSVLLNLEFKKQRYLVADIEKVVSK